MGITPSMKKNSSNGSKQQHTEHTHQSINIQGDKQELLCKCIERCKNCITDSITKGSHQAWKSKKLLY